MFPAQRRALIIEHLRREEAASLRDLAERIGISLSTVRRDIDYLCETGHLERTHGGAISRAAERRSFEPEAEIAAALFSSAKRAIARRAALIIAPGQSVIFDSGTTTAAVAEAARERAVAFTAVTNDLAIGASLSRAPNVATTVTGGQVRPGSPTLLGATTAASIGRLHADLAFIGTHALTETALSDTTPELAEIKRLIITAADVVVLVADSSKFFTSALCSFANLGDVDLIITDSGLPEAEQAQIRASGAALEIVDAG